MLEVQRSRLFPVRWPYKSLPLYVLKSHESFTYVSPDVFSVLYKTLIFNILQDIVRVSFSAPNLQDSSWRFFCVLNRRSRAVRGRFCFSLQQFISSFFRPYFRRLLTNNRLFSGGGKTIWCNKPVFTLVQQYFQWRGFRPAFTKIMFSSCIFYPPLAHF